MPINAIPDRSDIVEDAGRNVWTTAPSWREFFRSVFYALFGWKRSYSASLSFNFGLIGAGAQLTTTVAVPGARQSDAVLVTPKTLVAGLDCWGIVTANDVVTVVRANFTAGAIDPAADDFRIVIFQQ